MPYCPECGKGVRDEASFCRECGNDLETLVDDETSGHNPADPAATTAASQSSTASPTTTSTSGDEASTGSELTEQYSIAVWIAAGVVALLTLPLGLIIPVYFYLKASKGTGIEQGNWEIWTVVLWGILGIIAVEVGGEKGAKILWGIIGVLLLLVLLILIAVA